jgi:hypothetical protein
VTLVVTLKVTLETLASVAFWNEVRRTSRRVSCSGPLYPLAEKFYYRAGIDFATDSKIQAAIREEFGGALLLTSNS